MRKYNELLKNVANEFHISQGAEESDEMYKCRLVYSILGRMSYASLWDIQEDGQSVSKIHFKRHISQLFDGYREMYPEIRPLMSCDAEQLGKEICDIYIKTGNIYQAPYRLAPSAPCQCSTASVCLTKGMPLCLKQRVSGIGTYTSSVADQFKVVSVDDMFMLRRVEDCWSEAVQDIRWSVCEDASLYEFLRLAPPFNRSYWTDQLPKERNLISMARTKLPGARLYYFYKQQEDSILISPIPEWRIKEPITQPDDNQSDNSNYRELSNGLLLSLSVLPPIRYHSSGKLVTMSLDYLPSPAIHNFIKLYSWPGSFQNFPSNFNRVFEYDIFILFKVTLERLGYQFVEE